MSKLLTSVRRVRVNGVRQCLWASRLGGVYTLVRGRPVVYRVEVTGEGLKVLGDKAWIHEVAFRDIVGPAVSTEVPS